TGPSWRRHESLVHPLAKISTEPFARKVSAEALLLTCFVDQRAGGSELNTDSGIALVVDDVLIAFSAGMPAGQDLAKLGDLFPAELPVVDQIQQLTLLV